MKKAPHRSDCPICNSLEVWGDKWSLLIVRDLMLAKECTYGDFLKSEEKISTNILASRLQFLEENGIIQKLKHPESKAKVLYRLTPKGSDLLPVMIEINKWAQKYFALPDKSEKRLEDVKEKKEASVKSGRKGRVD